MAIYVRDPACPEPPETRPRCPIFWCRGLHDEPDDGHLGMAADFAVTTHRYAGGMQHDCVSIGLEQADGTGELLVAFDGIGAAFWLTRQQAKELAIHLLQMDLAAGTLDDD